jgi:hypothetical protein
VAQLAFFYRAFAKGVPMPAATSGKKLYYPARILMGIFIGACAVSAGLHVYGVFHNLDAIMLLILLPFLLSVLGILFWPFSRKLNFALAVIGLVPITLFFNYIPSGHLDGQAGLGLLALPLVHLFCLGILLIIVSIVELVSRFTKVPN